MANVLRQATATAHRLVTVLSQRGWRGKTQSETDVELLNCMGALLAAAVGSKKGPRAIALALQGKRIQAQRGSSYTNAGWFAPVLLSGPYPATSAAASLSRAALHPVSACPRPSRG
jgi:hypothetical protein